MSKEKKIVSQSQPASSDSNVEEVLTRTEQFIEQHQKKLTAAAIALIVLIAGIYLVNRYYLKPREEAAQADMFTAQNYISIDSFKLALHGDGVSYLGFLEVAEEYPFTRASKLARYYAGICYLKLGQHDEAIEQFEKCRLKSPLITPMCLGNTGDAYVEKGDLEKAVLYYRKAAGYSDNDLTTPMFLMKAGKVYEQLKDYEEALKMYKKIQTEYSRSLQARMIEKYIARVETLLANQ